MKIALITGANRGIGAAVSEALAARKVVPVLAVRSAHSAKEVHARVLASGAQAEVVRCDVMDAEDVRTALAQVVTRFGHLDIVINNAGLIDPIGHIAETRVAEWARTIDTNLVGAYHVVQAALPLLTETRGAIVNLSSGAAHTPREGWSAYCCSKAALAMLTRCIHLEYGECGVAAYGVQPGLVDTDMQVRIRASGVNEISRVPRDQLAPPENSAAMIAWLADTKPEDLRGQDLRSADPALVERMAAAGN